MPAGHHRLDQETDDGGGGAEVAVLSLFRAMSGVGRRKKHCRWTLFEGMRVYPIPCLCVVVLNAL